MWGAAKRRVAGGYGLVLRAPPGQSLCFRFCSSDFSNLNDSETSSTTRPLVTGPMELAGVADAMLLIARFLDAGMYVGLGILLDFCLGAGIGQQCLTLSSGAPAKGTRTTLSEKVSSRHLCWVDERHSCPECR